VKEVRALRYLVFATRVAPVVALAAVLASVVLHPLGFSGGRW